MLCLLPGACVLLGSIRCRLLRLMYMWCGLSVCLSVMCMSNAKMAEHIKVLFAVETPQGARSTVLDSFAI